MIMWWALCTYSSSRRFTYHSKCVTSIRQAWNLSVFVRWLLPQHCTSRCTRTCRRSQAIKEHLFLQKVFSLPSHLALLCHLIFMTIFSQVIPTAFQYVPTQFFFAPSSMCLVTPKSSFPYKVLTLCILVLPFVGYLTL